VSYESRAYDKPNTNGFAPDPVVVLVVTGTHDVSRLVNLLAGTQPVIEQIGLAEQVRHQVRRHHGGRAALELLHQHGGPDFTTEPSCCPPPQQVNILRLAATGLTTAAIGTALGKATGSIANDLTRLYRAKGFRNITHAVAGAYEHGWLRGAS
jgi:DNA-binding NarL/FixJ family response regulator